MKEDELLYALALQKTKGIGDIIAKKLITTLGSASAVYQEKLQNIKKLNGIGTITLANLKDKTSIKEAEKEIEFIIKNNIKTRYFLDDDYPTRLKYCIDGPILYFQKGETTFENRKVVSIVGTRNMTPYGRDCCEQIISDLKSYNPIIVSGFAYGVDICAHRAAIKNGLETVAVLAQGFASLYPKTHKKYEKELLENGSFITEFWYHEKPLREHFLQRNRIIAGLSEATIVIESAEKGGSLVTADIADSYNRDVFAVPGRTTDKYSKGCNQLIKQNKAIMLNTVEDLINELHWEQSSTKKQAIQAQLFIELSETEQLIVSFLQSNGKQQLDLISLNNQLTIQQTAAILFNLEMKGIVKPL
ncbi:MAG: DNA-processing protein DprA, partial [Flavobacteriaceae bacterium]|nr:DNA-processing protein DprA [Flavobacteriaceae bacterium]